MKKVNTSLIVRLCLPQFAVGLFTTMLNNYLIYFYQPSKESGIPNLMLVYDKEASNKTIGRKPRYFVINQVLPSKA